MKRTLALVVCLFAAISPAFAILGIGDVVFDPTNYAEAIQQLLQLERQYSQLVQTYQTVRGQYEHMIRMAQTVPVNMKTRYRAVATPWHTSTAANTYGTTSGWINGINSGVNVAAGYAQAIESLTSYGPALSNIPSGQAGRIKTAYSTVELADGANLHGIETLGRLRANSSAVETAIQGLESDSLSSDPAMNTEIGVLNKINAAGVIALHGAQDTNKLLVTLAEQQIVESKRNRDAQAVAINDHVRFVTEGKAVLNAQSANASSAMLAWRMP